MGISLCKIGQIEKKNSCIPPSPSASTRSLFDTMGNCVLDWVLDGYNAVVLGMGPVDSGKTYSLFGEQFGDRRKGPKGAGNSSSSTSLLPSPLCSPIEDDGVNNENGEMAQDNANSSTIPQTRKPAVIELFLRELFKQKKRDQVVGMSWWEVRGGECWDFRGEKILEMEWSRKNMDGSAYQNEADGNGTADEGEEEEGQREGEREDGGEVYYGEKDGENNDGNVTDRLDSAEEQNEEEDNDEEHNSDQDNQNNGRRTEQGFGKVGRKGSQPGKGQGCNSEKRASERRIRKASARNPDRRGARGTGTQRGKRNMNSSRNSGFQDEHLHRNVDDLNDLNQEDGGEDEELDDHHQNLNQFDDFDRVSPKANMLQFDTFRLNSLQDAEKCLDCMRKTQQSQPTILETTGRNR